MEQTKFWQAIRRWSLIFLQGLIGAILVWIFIILMFAM